MPPASSASFAQFFPAAPRAARDKAKEREQRVRVKAAEPPSTTTTPNGINDRDTPAAPDKSEENRLLYGSDTVVSQATDDGDVLMNGDTPVTVGSASSHASTASSVFSSSRANGLAASQNNHAYLTPLSTTESPAHAVAASRHAETDAFAAPCTQPGAYATTHGSLTPTAATATKSALLVERPSAIDSNRATTATACTYNPWLDEHLSIPEKQRARPKFKTYGPISDDAPAPDPRLGTGGRLNYINVDYHLPRSRLRLAPYTLKPYRYDAKTSVGPGPPTQIVVTGFSPLITFSKVVNIFSTFGEIAESSNKMHPEIGNFLGFATFRFRDSGPHRSRPRPVSAVDAARRAVKQMNGKRIEENQVKVEFDPEGRKSGRMLEDVVKADREKMRSIAKPPTRIPTAPRAAIAVSGMAPGPPPTAPKAPAALRQADPSRQAGPLLPGMEFIEREPIAPKLTTQPVIFVTGEKVPVKHQTISHLKKRLKAFQWDSLRADMTGYYIIFDDSNYGRSEAARCFRAAKGTLFFNYELGMVLHHAGMRPREPKATMPPKQPVEQRKRDFSPERKAGPDVPQQSREEEMDLEAEKRQRALNFDPVREAEAVIRKEMTEHLIKHIRTKIAVPTLFEFLDPAKHQQRLQQLNLSTFKRPILPSLGIVGKQTTVGTPNSRADPIERRTNRADAGALPRMRKAKHGTLMARRGGFVDPFARQRPPAKARAVRSLHHRLKVIDSDDESEAENRSSMARDTEEPESRPRSGMSTDDEEPDRDDVASSWGPFEEDSMTEASFSVVDGVAVPSRKRKLELPIDVALKRQRKTDEELFGITIDRIETEYALDEDEDVAMPDIQVKDETDSSRATPALLEVGAVPAPKHASTKRPKKTKKQLLEEREAAKKKKQQQEEEASEQEALRQAREAESTPGPSSNAAEVQAVKVNADPALYPTSPNEPAFRLPPDFALDFASYQSLQLPEEDSPDLAKFKKKFRAADVEVPEAWVWRRKRILLLNASGWPKPELPSIEGYYVPNRTGCARTEGIKKIFNAEKAKYLPHVIKVKKAREERVAEAGKASKVLTAKVANEVAATKSSSRAHRATQRRIANDLTEQQKAYGQESDLLRFNQLQKRKKPVKFARSAIHNWGLFAMVDIAKDEMIIEYVGEEVRQSVSKVRERKYDQAGVGSSYLFSLAEGNRKNVGDENVIDATKKGGIARFINHSCMPNCTAKIIQVNGGPRIVLYALRDIAQNEELTYDYKFELEADADDRVPCLCGTIACKGYLN